MRIEIIKQIDAETRCVWEFNLFDISAVFVGWRKETKPKGKRIWKLVEYWNYYNERDSSVKRPPKLTKEIREEVVEEIIKIVRVFTWSEWKQK